MNFDDQIWQSGIKKNLWQKGDLILVACSGGIDSMGLLEFFRLWRERNRVRLMAIHCDHQIRGYESEKDAENVKHYCDQNQIPIIVCELGVLEYQAKYGGNLEEIARNLRYEAINEVAKKYQITRIALGHHQGDQAETVLLHLLRGSGSFRGMVEQEGMFIRPFLSVTKEEIFEFLKERKVPYWEDSTNQDCDLKRNWVRQHLLPMVETIEPNVKKILSRWATIQVAEEDFWKNYSQKWVETYGELGIDQSISLPLDQFNQLMLAEKRQVVRWSLGNIKNSLRGIELGHVESVIEIAEKNIGNSQVSLPAAIIAKIFKGRLYLLLNKKEEIEFCGPRYESSIVK